MTQVAQIDGGTLTMKRSFSAPVEKVYAAWIEPERLKQWFSPNVRWLAPTIEAVSQVGGVRTSR
jgi:uncharacterized protein YndB with AHSA1/START domain